MLLLALAAAVATGARATAAEPEVIDDWRRVGPPDAGAAPKAKGILSPAAAEALVTAIDQAWRSGAPLRARDDMAWILDNLRYAFVPASGLPAPRTMGTPQDREREKDRLRRIDVIGSRPVSGHHLLLALAHVDYDIYGETFAPVALAIVLRPDGAVTDLAVLTQTFGDACTAVERKFRVEPTELRVSHKDLFEGRLCTDASADDECCSVSEGSTAELAVGPAGRFQIRLRRLTLSGQFADAATGEEILIEDNGKALRLGYRAKAKAPWKHLKIVSSERKLGVVVVQFEKSRVTYTLTVAEDGRSLVSAGSDGSKPQRFVWIPLNDRYRREPER
jgi:hypothetical protein